MVRIRTGIVIAFLSIVLAVPCQFVHAGSHEGHAAKNDRHEREQGHDQRFIEMPAPGEKVPCGDGYYFIYGFDRQPDKIGTSILKVQVFSRQGKKDTSFEITADSGMPSMRGAHETGDRPLKLSKKGDYLIPIDIVMPGDWEVRITVMKDGKVIFRGSYQFDV